MTSAEPAPDTRPALLVDDLVVRLQGRASARRRRRGVLLDSAVVLGFFALMLLAATRAYPKAIL
jgi:hypothetical protein